MTREHAQALTSALKSLEGTMRKAGFEVPEEGYFEKPGVLAAQVNTYLKQHPTPEAVNPPVEQVGEPQPKPKVPLGTKLS